MNTIVFNMGNGQYDITGCQDLKAWDTKLEILGLGNYWILRIGLVASCQKLGIILVIM